MELQTEIKARAQANVRRAYSTIRARPLAPHAVKPRPGNRVGEAATALFPWGLDAYPGFYKGLHALFKSRASIHTIRDWQRGKRKAPAWARALLLEAVEKRIAALEHAKALLNAATNP